MPCTWRREEVISGISLLAPRSVYHTHNLHTHTHMNMHTHTYSANILLDSHFVPKLSDFGLARECQSKAHQKSTYCTQSSVVMGTMAYLAPEFLRNRKMTPKMDVYSFGVVLLELYTGLAADDPTVQQRALVGAVYVHVCASLSYRMYVHPPDGSTGPPPGRDRRGHTSCHPTTSRNHRPRRPPCSMA